MIRELLQRRFPIENGLSADGIATYAIDCSGRMVLSDTKACTQCRCCRPERKMCNGENLQIEFGETSVVCVDSERYIGQYDNTQARVAARCDYLFVDDIRHEKVVFCDLTCSEEKYVLPNNGMYKLGKRAKAVAQMKNSLECLLKIPLFDHYLLTFPKKVCLFGWRDYKSRESEIENNKASHSMLTFMRTPSAEATSLYADFSILNHGFAFVQVKYPEVYEW